MLPDQPVGEGSSKLHRWSRVLHLHLATILLAIVAIAFLLSGGVAFLYAYNFAYPLSEDQAIWGSFGDFLGGVLNPLLSLLALIALLLTVFLQSDELRLSREELSLTREELRKSAEAQEKAQQALTQQLENSIKASRLEYLNVLTQAEFRILQRLQEPRTIRARAIRKKTLDRINEHENEISEFASGLERTKQSLLPGEKA